eukprot:TRINITY_DN9375_c0_g4_i1.p1 TRINITY_DN9375_c0_g4~~TRINITY_DN9375_c0_g4_i1.p1  ORF type:complete len:155 (+),score=51.50 TRINITY_DN9375_c0_g4_i1:261-725(+)
MLLERSFADATYLVQDLKESENIPETEVENKKASESELSEYDKINKPFLSKSKIVENTEQYAVFLGLFKIPRGSRAKRMSRRKFKLSYVDALILLIEQIYTEKFMTDTNQFKAAIKEGKRDEVGKQTFPSFVSTFLKTRIKSSKQLVQVALPLT